MSKLVISNIRHLLQADLHPPQFRSGKEMLNLSVINNAWLSCKDGIIEDFGEMKTIPHNLIDSSDEWIDASGRIVLPSFCDPHTHIVYAGSREKEFVMKIQGMSYEEIALKGGGILNSAALLHDTSEDELYQQSVPRIREIMKMGTGAVEIKSGYGLNTADEIKMLRVIRRLKENFPIVIRATFLGAHAIPAEYKKDQDAYVDIIISEMIPLVAAQDLADFIDVFCEEGFFTPANTERILTAGMKYGLKPKIHANELGFSGGIQVGVKYDALSVDHLEYTGEREIELLKNSDTMPTLLPGTSFFLGLPYAPARKMIDSGVPVALASDYNPGSSPSGNMKFILSLACTQLKMLPAEAINAATLNAAYAMGVEDILGTITPGKRANLIITEVVPSVDFLPYAFGSDLIWKVMLGC
jgi:imidazolonepropionase